MRAYGRILRSPNMAPLFAWTVLARLPIGINGLATVLFLQHETGSFAVAGAVAGSEALGAGIGAPVAARLVDRFGKGVLLAFAVAHAAALGALVALGYAGAPAAALLAAGLVMGIAIPPVSSVMRVMYPRLLRDPTLIQGAFALDSVLTETIFVAGPLITGVLVIVAEPAAALGVSAVAVTTGTAFFLAALPAGERHTAPADHDLATPSRLGALRSPGVRALIASMLPVGFALGALEVAIPGFAAHEGRPELAGVLIAIWSIGSAIGGLVYGARPRQSSLAAVHLRMALILPLSLIPMAFAASPLSMAVLVVPAGLFIAPLLASRNELAGEVAPAGSETEALTWPLTAMVAGVALGAGVAGVLVDALGWRAPVVVAVAAAAAGAAVSVALRDTMREPEPTVA
jgi:MFS family permease